MSVQLEHYLPFFSLVFFFGKINGGPDQTLPTTTAREDALIKSTTLESIKSEQPRRPRVNKSPLTSCLVCSDRLAACFHTIGCGIRVDQSFSPRTLFAARIVLNGQRAENCYWSDGVKISTSHFFFNISGIQKPGMICDAKICTDLWEPSVDSHRLASCDENSALLESNTSWERCQVLFVLSPRADCQNSICTLQFMFMGSSLTGRSHRLIANVDGQ